MERKPGNSEHVECVSMRKKKVPPPFFLQCHTQAYQLKNVTELSLN